MCVSTVQVTCIHVYMYTLSRYLWSDSQFLFLVPSIEHVASTLLFLEPGWRGETGAEKQELK